MYIDQKTVLFSLLIFIFLFGCKKENNSIHVSTDTAHQKVEIAIEDKYAFAELKDVHMEGEVGKELDRVILKRISSDFAASEIAPEATKAFETRMDDQFHENRGLWQGEFWGKWILSAIAAYQYTGDESIKETIDRETKRLIKTQDKNGYIGSYKNSAFVEGDVWNVWNRKYALWGLIEAYEVLGDSIILESAKRMMNHLMTEVGPKKVSMVDTGNFYGLPSSSILTPLIKLYKNTNNQEYLNYAEYIVKNWNAIPDSPPSILQKGLTGVPVHEWFPEKGKWTKAYEFISCVEGLVDLYQIVGNPDYLTAAQKIYKTIKVNERVITGGIGYHDKLVGASLKPEGLNEPCDVVYWERLSAKLLAITGEQLYADEIERLIYNVLLASFNEQGDWAVRRLGLNEPHLVAPLHAFTNYHQCCVANVPRGMLQLGEVVVMSARQKNELLVNLYIPGSYSVKLSNGKKVNLKVQTEYPKNGEINILLNSDSSFESTLKFRKPDWSPSFSVKVNDIKIGELSEESFSIKRKWNSGDSIKIMLEVGQRIISIPNNENYKALMWGPVVLARSSLLEPKENLDKTVSIENLKLIPVSGSDKTNNTWMEFTATAISGKTFKLCDYSSTGKVYEKPSNSTEWIAMIKNRVSSDQRVWLKINK